MRRRVHRPSEVISEGAAVIVHAAPEDDPSLVFDLELLAPALQRSYWRVKRITDPAMAATLLVLLAPLLCLLALAVALDVGAPAVFWQQRPGARGHPFKLYKFRTMRSAHDQSGARIPDAERISPVGRFLRRTRLDELPQLYNILIGDMSFVGPRPLLPVDGASKFAARLLVPPGLTGWAQVNGGCQVVAHDKAVLDIWYLRHASLRLDLTILKLTLRTMVLGERIEHAALERAWDELTGSAIATTDARPDVGPTPPKARPAIWELDRATLSDRSPSVSQSAEIPSIWPATALASLPQRDQ